MGKLIMVTGGARSGKSTFAEKKAGEIGQNVLYVATSIPLDEEMKLRIEKHREQRPVCWETLEAYRDMDIHLPDMLEGRSAVLLDCITIMVCNLMFDIHTEWDRVSRDDILETEYRVVDQVKKLLSVAEASEVPFIVVTNELGMGIVPDNKLTRVYRDIAGRVNQMLAGAAHEVYFCVSGIPVKIK